MRSGRPGSAAGDGRDDADLVLRLDLGVEVVEVADVLVVDVDVDEPAQLGAVEDPLLQAGMLLEDLAEDLADGRAGRLDAVEPAGVGAERGGDS